MSLLLDALKRAELAKQTQSEQVQPTAEEGLETDEANASPSLELVNDSITNDTDVTTSKLANEPTPKTEIVEHTSRKLDIVDEPEIKKETLDEVSSQKPRVKKPLPQTNVGGDSGTRPDVVDDGLSDFVPNTALDCVAPEYTPALPNMSFITERSASVSAKQKQSLTLEQPETAVNGNPESHTTESIPTDHSSDGISADSHIASENTQPAYQSKSKKSNLRFIGASITVLLLLGAGGTWYFIKTLDQISLDSNLSRITPPMTVAEDLEVLNNTAATLAQSDAELSKIPTEVNSNPVTSAATVPAKTVKKPAPNNNIAKNKRISSVKSVRFELNGRAETSQTRSLNIVRKNRVDPIQVLLSKAYSAYVVSNYEKANRLYREALKLKNNNRDALLGLAVIAHRNNQPNQARLYYKKLLSLNPKDSQASAGLIALVQGSNATESESRLKILLENEPQAAHLHFTLGNQYVSQARWADAQKAFFQAYSADPGNADYAMNLAVSLDHIKQPRAAAQYYQLALELARGKNVSFSVLDVAARIKVINAGARQ